MSIFEKISGNKKKEKAQKAKEDAEKYESYVKKGEEIDRNDFIEVKKEILTFQAKKIGIIKEELENVEKLEVTLEELQEEVDRMIDKVKMLEIKSEQKDIDDADEFLKNQAIELAELHNQIEKQITEKKSNVDLENCATEKEALLKKIENSDE